MRDPAVGGGSRAACATRERRARDANAEQTRQLDEVDILDFVDRKKCDFGRVWTSRDEPPHSLFVPKASGI
jgi:hypothetical protein